MKLLVSFWAPGWIIPVRDAQLNHTRQRRCPCLAWRGRLCGWLRFWIPMLALLFWTSGTISSPMTIPTASGSKTAPCGLIKMCEFGRTVGSTSTSSAPFLSGACLGARAPAAGASLRFFVGKKGNKQRLVFDCRRTNQRFCHAPFTEIGCSEAFSSIEVPSGQCLYSASADVVSCFYQCGIPVELSEFFCLDGISGAEALAIGFRTNLDGTPILGSEAELFPALLVLPMGWGWAFWFVQRAHLEIIRRAGVPAERVALGGWPIPPVRDGPIEIPYCDNVTVVGLDAGSVVAL